MTRSRRQTASSQITTSPRSPSQSPRQPAPLAFKFIGFHDNCGLDGSLFSSPRNVPQGPSKQGTGATLSLSQGSRRKDSLSSRGTATWLMPSMVRSESEISDPSENTVDKLGLYGAKQRRLYAKIEDESDLLPPLELSPRAQAHVPDGGVVRERRLISEDSVVAKGGLAKFSRDEVFVPTVYPQYWESLAHRDSYVRQAFARKCLAAKRAQGSTGPACPQQKSVSSCSSCARASLRASQFCEILGSRYCRRCGEVSNRNFSQSYQKHKLPPLVGGDKKKTIHVTIPT